MVAYLFFGSCQSSTLSLHLEFIHHEQRVSRIVHRIFQMKVQQRFTHCHEYYSISNGNIVFEISQDYIT